MTGSTGSSIAGCGAGRRERSFRGKYLLLMGLLLYPFLTGRAAADTLTGFTLHFDFIDNWEQAERLIVTAHENGAEILNVVPPPRIGTLPASRAILDNIFRLTGALHMRVVLSRIDACPVSADDPERTNYLFSEILVRPGVLPSGKPTSGYFRETVGLRRYEQWMREETAYYRDRYAGEGNLIGFSVGLFNEPFVSERGGLLCFDESTDSYEIAQYTPSCREYWQAWLGKRFGTMAEVNRRYRTSFGAFAEVPLPLNEDDSRFGAAPLAYRDYVTAVNDWVVKQYRDCRAVWNGKPHRPIPLILQFSGYVPEKFSKGRPAFAALDIFSWMQAADALGLSLYTNDKYPDWGHASDRAMVHFLCLGMLQKKRVFVMEGGNESDGAVLVPAELDFIAHAARVLQPDGYVYEFFAAPYYAHYRDTDGYILDRDGTVNATALRAIGAVFAAAKQPARLSGAVYVFDDPRSLSDDDLRVQKELQIKALEGPLIFVPEGSLSLLPEGSTLLVVPENRRPAIFRRLTARSITIVPAREWLRISK